MRLDGFKVKAQHSATLAQHFHRSRRGVRPQQAQHIPIRDVAVLRSLRDPVRCKGQWTKTLRLSRTPAPALFLSLARPSAHVSHRYAVDRCKENFILLPSMRRPGHSGSPVFNRLLHSNIAAYINSFRWPSLPRLMFWQRHGNRHAGFSQSVPRLTGATGAWQRWGKPASEPRGWAWLDARSMRNDSDFQCG